MRDPDVRKLVARLNNALGQIYDLALFHQMQFDCRKFPLLDVGVKLDSHIRRQIVFGSPLGTSTKPSYLGILLDDNLSFTPFFKEISKVT